MRRRLWSRRRDAQARVVVVDFHAEATSEKVALARWLDGRVTAVIGTHTHVQTSDARVQPGGTAAITDAGMTGPHDSVIGVEAELAIRRMRTGMPVRFRPAEGGVRLEGVVVDCDADGRATAIETLRSRSAASSIQARSSVASSATRTRSRARTSHDATVSKRSARSQ